MKYLSLFTGIGGFELGITRAYERLHNPRHETAHRQEATEGVPRLVSDHKRNLVQGALSCVGYSEIDKYAVQIYQKHFPDHKNYGDITTIDETALPDFDLLVGGFPCQSFSIAGKRGGVDDARGTLFFDIARIAEAKKPKFLLLENVKGLLSSGHRATRIFYDPSTKTYSGEQTRGSREIKIGVRGETFFQIQHTLVQLDYLGQSGVLNSKDFGVPQNRERIFIVGHLRGTRRPEVFPFTDDGGQASELPRHVSNTLTARYYGAEAVGTYIGEGELNAQEPDGQDCGQGQAVPDTDFEPRREEAAPHPSIKIPEATKKGYAEATVGQAINLSVPNSTTRRGRVSDVAQTLDTGMQQHTLTNDAQIRRLTPTECERLQGFPDGWTEGVSDTQRYKTLGNAVTVNVIEAIVSRII